MASFELEMGMDVEDLLDTVFNTVRGEKNLQVAFDTRRNLRTVLEGLSDNVTETIHLKDNVKFSWMVDKDKKRITIQLEGGKFANLPLYRLVEKVISRMVDLADERNIEAFVKHFTKQFEDVTEEATESNEPSEDKPPERKPYEIKSKHNKSKRRHDQLSETFEETKPQEETN
jgi:hypothetical protein